MCVFHVGSVHARVPGGPGCAGSVPAGDGTQTKGRILRTQSETGCKLTNATLLSKSAQPEGSSNPGLIKTVYKSGVE